MAGCQSAGKSAIVYVVFRGECLATGVPEKERVSTRRKKMGGDKESGKRLEWGFTVCGYLLGHLFPVNLFPIWKQKGIAIEALTEISATGI